MKVVNYSDFRQNLVHYLNSVNNDREIVVVSRTKGKTVVVMDLEEYNAIQENLHLTAITGLKLSEGFVLMRQLVL